MSEEATNVLPFSKPEQRTRCIGRFLTDLLTEMVAFRTSLKEQGDEDGEIAVDAVIQVYKERVEEFFQRPPAVKPQAPKDEP